MRPFLNSSEENVREKVKAPMATVKQAYGGNIDMAVRSPQIRDWIAL